jgi:hypothetical protein
MHKLSCVAAARGAAGWADAAEAAAGGGAVGELEALAPVLRGLKAEAQAACVA